MTVKMLMDELIRLDQGAVVYLSDASDGKDVVMLGQVLNIHTDVAILAPLEDAMWTVVNDGDGAG